MATFTITRGDTSPSLRFELSPDTIDLTDATPVFSIRGVLDRAPAIVARLVPPTLQYDWQAGDTDVDPRVYPAEFEVTYAGGGVETFSADADGSRLAIRILDDIG